MNGTLKIINAPFAQPKTMTQMELAASIIEQHKSAAIKEVEVYGKNLAYRAKLTPDTPKVILPTKPKGWKKDIIKQFGKHPKKWDTIVKFV